MSKDHFIAAHEDLIDELIGITGCSWEQAYAATSEAAYERMRKNISDRVDAFRQRQKDAS